ATLDWPSLTARLRGRDPQARIDIDPAVADTARVEPAVQAALLRIAAEAVTNAVRHGEAPLSLQVRVGADGVDLSLVHSRARASAPGGGLGPGATPHRAAACGGGAPSPPAEGAEATTWQVRAHLPLRTDTSDARDHPDRPAEEQLR